MALITPEQIANIKDVIQTVTDTFFVTPITYHLAGESLDIFNEDRADQQFTDYALKGMVEFISNEGDKTLIDKEGGLNDQSIKVTFNYRDIKTAGLSDGNNQAKMNASKDYMTVNGRKYRVEYVGLDGPIEAENVLLVLYGELDNAKS